jgi:hypothetical protein
MRTLLRYIRLSHPTSTPVPIVPMANSSSDTGTIYGLSMISSAASAASTATCLGLMKFAMLRGLRSHLSSQASDLVVSTLATIA